jgi:hypothetical protein
MIELPPPSPMLWLPPKPAVIEPLRVVHPRLAVLPGMVAAIAAAESQTFPVIEGSNTGANAGGTGNSSYSAPLPAGITAGELLLLFVSAGAGAARTVTTPTGWSSLFNAIGAGSVRRFCCFHKIANGSEGASVSVSASANSFWSSTAYRISGYQGAPEAATTATGSASNPDPPNLTPSWGSAKALWIAAAGRDAGGASDFLASPANYSALIQNGGSGSANHSATASAYREFQGASENPGTFTSNSDWAANTVAIRPA